MKAESRKQKAESRKATASQPPLRIARITRTQKSRYLKAPYRCPFCRCEDIRDTGDTQHWGERITKEYRCDRCRRRWTDIYTLSDIDPSDILSPSV